MQPPPLPTSPPRVAWFGAPPPPDVAEELASVAHIVQGGDRPADIVVVRADAGLTALEGLPLRLAGAPVIATLPDDPSPADRMAWIKAGAEDLVAFDHLPVTLARRLRRIRRDPSPVDGLSAPPGPPEPAPTAARPALQPPPLPRDDFPPLQVPRPADGVPDALSSWVRQMRGYLRDREALLQSALNPGGASSLERYLELLHLRDQLGGDGDPTSSFERVHGDPSVRVDWPTLVRRGPQRGRQTVEVAEARIVAIGTDGVTAELPFAASPRQKLVMDLPADDASNAQLLVQARWQRRLSADKWLLGLLILDMRVRDSLPAA